MKIGIFDSGLGGLIITRALVGALPQYDYAYLGDTANLPYGTRSPELVRALARKGVDWLFREQGCAIVIIACNTASIAALRNLQTDYLPANFPGRKVLGVVIPTMEAVAAGEFRRVGLIATQATIKSGVYEQELSKLSSDIIINSLATPLLAPLIENGGDKYAPGIIADYLAGMGGIDALVLGCTHYPYYKNLFAAQLPGVKIISQDEIIPAALADYLARHGEVAGMLSCGGSRFFGITDVTDAYALQAERMFGEQVGVEKAWLA